MEEAKTSVRLLFAVARHNYQWIKSERMPGILCRECFPDSLIPPQPCDSMDQCVITTAPKPGNEN